jgi:hypothetical protein
MIFASQCIDCNQAGNAGCIQQSNKKTHCDPPKPSRSLRIKKAFLCAFGASAMRVIRLAAFRLHG